MSSDVLWLMSHCNPHRFLLFCTHSASISLTRNFELVYFKTDRITRILPVLLMVIVYVRRGMLTEMNLVH